MITANCHEARHLFESKFRFIQIDDPICETGRFSILRVCLVLFGTGQFGELGGGLFDFIIRHIR